MAHRHIELFVQVGALGLKCLSKLLGRHFLVGGWAVYFERAERARYRSTTRVRVCASLSNRQLGSGLEVPFETSFAQLAELHTVSHSAATPARGNMPAATRVQFCVLVEVTWYPTDPPVYPRCQLAAPYAGRQRYLLHAHTQIAAQRT